MCFYFVFLFCILYFYFFSFIFHFLFIVYLVYEFIINIYNQIEWKKRSERRKHCALAVVRRNEKKSPRRRPPSRERRTRQPKFISAGDGHYLHLQTQFGEYRCMQFRVIVATDPQTNKPINTHTNRQDQLQYTAPLSLARR